MRAHFDIVKYFLRLLAYSIALRNIYVYNECERKVALLTAMYGEVFKLLRQKTGLSQKDFAAQFGIAQSTYALYELEKREPPFALLGKFVKHFGVSYDYLLTGVESDQQDVQKATGLSGEALDVLCNGSDLFCRKIIDDLLTWGNLRDIAFEYYELLDCIECDDRYEALEAARFCSSYFEKFISDHLGLDERVYSKRAKAISDLYYAIEQDGREVEIRAVLHRCNPSLSDEKISEIINNLDKSSGGEPNGTPEET